MEVTVPDGYEAPPELAVAADGTPPAAPDVTAAALPLPKRQRIDKCVLQPPAFASPLHRGERMPAVNTTLLPYSYTPHTSFTTLREKVLR